MSATSLWRRVVEVAEVVLAGLDSDGPAVAARGAAEPALLVPDLQDEVARRGVVDAEVAVLVGDGEVRVIEDAGPALHPRVDVALDDDRQAVGDQARDDDLLAGRGELIAGDADPRVA